jgi:DNA-binding MarR family transcriptional regulator
MNAKTDSENWDVLLFVSHLLMDIITHADEFAPNIMRVTLAQTKTVGLILERHPDGIMLKDVAKELGITPSAASQTVDALVKEGIIERCVSERDRRAVLLRPSPKGREIRERHRLLVNRLMEKVLASVPKSDQKTALRILSLMFDRLLEEKRQLFH